MDEVRFTYFYWSYINQTCVNTITLSLAEAEMCPPRARPSRSTDVFKKKKNTTATSAAKAMALDGLS